MADRADVPVIPPVIPTVALSIGGIAHLIYPIGLGDYSILRLTGYVLILISISTVAIALRQIKAARTAFDVRKPTTSLLTSGIFSISRNPTYLSMQLLSTGIALAANSLPLLISTVLAGSALCLLVIRREEDYLEGKFGDEYRRYMTSVRRWI